MRRLLTGTVIALLTGALLLVPGTDFKPAVRRELRKMLFAQNSQTRLVVNEPDGIWGGFDESERAWLRLALAEGTPVPAILDPYTGTAAA